MGRIKPVPRAATRVATSPVCAALARARRCGGVVGGRGLGQSWCFDFVLLPRAATLSCGSGSARVGVVVARRGLRRCSTWRGADAGAEWSLAAMERSSWEQRGRRGWGCGAIEVGARELSSICRLGPRWWRVRLSPGGGGQWGWRRGARRSGSKTLARAARASGKQLGSLTASGGRRERPTLVHPCARGYIPRTICRGSS